MARNSFEEVFEKVFTLLMKKLKQLLKWRKLLGFVIGLIVFYRVFFTRSSSKTGFTSAVRCKADVAKVAIPSEKQRREYLLPLGTDYKTIEEDFFYLISSITTNCQNQEHLGPPEEGGWDVCLEPRYDITPPCLVYSFGVGNTFEFEKDVERVLKCEVHAFDPSIGLESFQFSKNGHFHNYGIDNINTKDTRTGWTMKRLGDIMKELDHRGRNIDILKMDVEFSEWLVLNDLITANHLQFIRQLYLEIHTPEVDIHERPDHRCSKTSPDSIAFMLRTLVDLKNAGFSLFGSRTNYRTKFISPVSGKERYCCHNLHFVNTRHHLNRG
ncbi:hypothetical protein HELRODRAFT_189946 [Helobdella robusta]|uniref:Methyltransferase domain-containing protein n=1 Tax=Helobdella robusta TaxID=6412 RepID=T1FRI7_HELRO|nr:hypothetical protein HELRODRAFT_189946 [Helobdella robusta]ESN90678.1 hypothetical protein HELRODRAFT_189946 [Helobdella robusta]